MMMGIREDGLVVWDWELLVRRQAPEPPPAQTQATLHHLPVSSLWREQGAHMQIRTVARFRGPPEIQVNFIGSLEAVFSSVVV
jgi:hypothetical protein